MQKPKLYTREKGEKHIISFRWYCIKIDIIKQSDFLLIQYGKKEVKFICRVKEGARPPMFLFSRSWTTTRTVGSYRFGHTRKPVDVAQFWRKQCGNSILGRYQSGNMTNLATSSGNIAITATKE